jgi:uncharacterized FAD-dependent dehydrogenase
MKEQRQLSITQRYTNELSNTLSELSPEIDIPDTLLHPPVGELCTARVRVSSGKETNIPRLYVVRDVSGCAKDIIQATTICVAAG